MQKSASLTSTAPGHGLTRRSLLGGSIAAASALGLPRIVRADTATMTVPNSGGALEDAYRLAYFDTFTAKTGVKILGAPYMDTAVIKAMVDANAVDIDVANIDFAEAAVLSKLGLLEPIDYGIVDRKSFVPWAAADNYIVSDVAATVMAWNTQSFTEDTRPKGWTEFFDVTAKPGQRSLWKLAPQTMEVAALGAGIAPDKLYPINVDAAVLVSRLRSGRGQVDRAETAVGNELTSDAAVFVHHHVVPADDLG